MVLISFSSMPVKARLILACVVRMLERSRHDHAIVFVGKRWKPRSVSKRLEAKIGGFKADGKFLEVGSADFGILFPRVDAFIVHGGLGTTVEALRTAKPVAISGVLLCDPPPPCECMLTRHLGGAPLRPAPLPVNACSRVGL